MLRGIVTVGALAIALASMPAGCGGDSTQPPPSSASTIDSGSPSEIDLPVAPEYEAGKLVVAQSGCLACHQIGESGSDGPGPDLTEIGSTLAPAEIGRAVVDGPGIMPGYDSLKAKEQEKFADMVAFLSSLSGS